MFTSIRDLILSYLDSNEDNVYDGITKYQPISQSVPGDESKAVLAFIHCVAKGIFDSYSYIDDVFEAYWVGGDPSPVQNITTALAPLEFNTVRIADPSFDWNGGTTITVQEAGRYAFDFSAAFDGGSSKREVDMWLYQNGAQIPGTRTLAAWDGASLGAGASSHTVVDAAKGDSFFVSAQLVAGSGPVQVISDTATFVATRLQDK